MGVHVVWFKRDLRVEDHPALCAAAEAAQGDGGRVLALWVYEDEVWHAVESDARHLVFCNQSLGDLERRLGHIGLALVRRRGRVPGVFDALANDLAGAGLGGIAALWSSEETGQGLTFDRDKRVKRWARERGVAWNELAATGVQRPIGSRDGWAKRWERRMIAPPVGVPARLRGAAARSVGELDARAMGVRDASPEVDPGDPRRQRGGAGEGEALIESFLSARGVNYQRDMSSPIAGWEGCSRLSPHLAWGTVSTRSVYHAVREREAALRALPAGERDPMWLRSLRSFHGRLRWRDHFMQKLEDEPSIEFRNMHRAYDGMRGEDERAWGELERERFEAWRLGRTGYPMVDACMRCLRATGWMNFRMRAMVVSFASYHLWLHWKPTATHLARVFIDYEPGIHFSQCQMQSGTTGINTVRIYSPAKQAADQDPRGVFIRRWVPELAGLRDDELAEPHGAEESGGLFGGLPGGLGSLGYPRPIVDHARAYRAARDRVFAVRASSQAKRESTRVYLKHGSRKRGGRPRAGDWTGREDRGGAHERNDRA